MSGENKYKNAFLIVLAIAVIEAALIIGITRGKAKIKPPPAPVKKALALKGKIAIVIDDWGYNVNNLAILEQIKYPITGSILPNLKFSGEVAGAFHKLGFQIILHLPMEPNEKYRMEQNTVLTTMDDKTIRDIVTGDLNDLAFVKGVSNHMGSKATEDRRTMGIVFDVLKERNLFFLDSLVTPKTVCSELAAKKHILFAKRDIFLDNKEEAGYIKLQINKLKKKAALYGEAIGIGHDRKVTLEVLKELMPEIEKEGFRFVFLSDLVS